MVVNKYSVTDGIRPRAAPTSRPDTGNTEEYDSPTGSDMYREQLEKSREEDRQNRLNEEREERRPGGRGPRGPVARYANTPSGQAKLAEKEAGEGTPARQAGITDRAVLYFWAGFFDAGCLLLTLLNFVIPVVGSILAFPVGVIGSVVMYNMFSKRGLINSGRNKAILAGVFAIKLIPVIDGYWALTTGTTAMLRIKKVEKKLGLDDGPKK